MNNLRLVLAALTGAAIAVSAMIAFRADDSPVEAQARAPRGQPAQRVLEKLRIPPRSDLPKATAYLVVYPVDSIELWEDTLPDALPGDLNKRVLKEQTELMLQTHYPYLKGGDQRSTLVNFQRELHRLMDAGATLIKIEGDRAWLTKEQVSLSQESRIGRDE